MMKYIVATDDNYHFMDEEERSIIGEFESIEEAISECKHIVEESLRREYKKGFSPEELYDQYTSFGDDPFIISNDKNVKFSAWDYAKEICHRVCQEKEKEQ